MAKIWDVLFGCSHKRYTFPITVRHGQRSWELPSVRGTYVVCLDCGKEFGYDWKEMKIVYAPENQSQSVREPAAEVAKPAA